MAKTANKNQSKKPESPSKKSAPRHRSISIRMSPRDLDRIDALIETVSESEAAREFGVEVDRSVVLRIAVIRGLAVMEAARGSAGPRSVTAETGRAGKAVVEPAAAKQDPPSPPTGVVKEEIKRSKDGLIAPPEGWHVWKSTERVPESQTLVHEYYTSKGWQRWWGKAGEESISFYWTGDERLQEVEAFSGMGPGGKGVLVQKTPHGPGHLVPHGWEA